MDTLAIIYAIGIGFMLVAAYLANQDNKRLEGKK